jgi:hypothetical protein
MAETPGTSTPSHVRGGTSADDRYNSPDLSQDLRRLSQAPLSLLTGWFELWSGYTMATHSTLNVVGQAMTSAAEDLTRSMDDMRRRVHQIQIGR